MSKSPRKRVNRGIFGYPQKERYLYFAKVLFKKKLFLRFKINFKITIG